VTVGAEDELALTERVGRELTKLGLAAHVKRLRRYYADVRAGRPSEVWTHAMSVEWLRVLRLPPYEHDYPVLPRMSICPCPTPQKLTQMVFPGGAKLRCAGCGAQWLELERQAE
jgi:hypothetical protein